MNTKTFWSNERGTINILKEKYNQNKNEIKKIIEIYLDAPNPDYTDKLHFLKQVASFFKKLEEEIAKKQESKNTELSKKEKKIIRKYNSKIISVYGRVKLEIEENLKQIKEEEEEKIESTSTIEDLMRNINEIKNKTPIKNELRKKYDLKILNNEEYNTADKEIKKRYDDTVKMLFDTSYIEDIDFDYFSKNSEKGNVLHFAGHNIVRLQLNKKPRDDRFRVGILRKGIAGIREYYFASLYYFLVGKSSISPVAFLVRDNKNYFGCITYMNILYQKASEYISEREKRNISKLPNKGKTKRSLARIILASAILKEIDPQSFKTGGNQGNIGFDFKNKMFYKIDHDQSGLGDEKKNSFDLNKMYTDFWNWDFIKRVDPDGLIKQVYGDDFKNIFDYMINEFQSIPNSILDNILNAIKASMLSFIEYYWYKEDDKSEFIKKTDVEKEINKCENIVRKRFQELKQLKINK